MQVRACVCEYVECIYIFNVCLYAFFFGIYMGGAKKMTEQERLKRWHIDNAGLCACVHMCMRILSSVLVCMSI